MKRQAVIGLVEKKGKFLLVKKPEALRWSVPGGSVKTNQAPEEAVINIIKQETNLDVELDDFLDVLITEDVDVYWYSCHANGDKIYSNRLETKWVKKEDLQEHLSEEAIKVYPYEVLKFLEIS